MSCKRIVIGVFILSLFLSVFPFSNLGIAAQDLFPIIPPDSNKFEKKRLFKKPTIVLQTSDSKLQALAGRKILEEVEGLSLPEQVDLELLYSHRVPGRFNRPDTTYRVYQQRVQGIAVEGSIFRMTSQEGKIRSSYTLIFPDLSIPTPNKLTDNVYRAGRALKVPMAHRPVFEKEAIQWVWGKWRRVKKIAFEGSQLLAHVDQESAEVFLQDARIYAVDGQITGRGILFDPLVTGDDLVSLPLGQLGLEDSGDFLSYTDSLGVYSLDAPLYPADVLVSLVNGQKVSIGNNQGAELEISVSVNDGDHVDLILNPSGNEEFDTAQVTAFYHVNVVHDWLVARGVNHANFSNPLQTHVNINDACNAFYSIASVSINFYRAGQDTGLGGTNHCSNSAYDTVVYHEFGHYVDLMFGGLTNSGLSEGAGDLLAAFVSGQPIVGENLYLAGSVNSTHYIRTADNNYQFPPSGFGQSHTLGQALAGFGWHLREMLIAQMGETAGIDYAEYLLLPAVFIANPEDIPGAVVETFLRDDDDLDLENGTPNFDLIMQAAQMHNLESALDEDPPVEIPPVNPNPGNGDGFTPNNAESPGNLAILSSSNESQSGGCQHRQSTSPWGVLPLFFYVIFFVVLKNFMLRKIPREYVDSI